MSAIIAAAAGAAAANSCGCGSSADLTLALRLARERTVEEIRTKRLDSSKWERAQSRKWSPWAILCFLSFPALMLAEFLPGVELMTFIMDIIGLGFLIMMIIWLIGSLVLMGKVSRTDAPHRRTCDLAIEIKLSQEAGILQVIQENHE